MERAGDMTLEEGGRRRSCNMFQEHVYIPMWLPLALFMALIFILGFMIFSLLGFLNIFGVCYAEKTASYILDHTT